MEFKGTKGEWRIKDNTGRIFSKEYSVQICSVSRQSSMDSNVDSQRDANSKLISKAPELLELLNHFIEISDELSVPDHLIETFANLYANAFNTIQEATRV